MFRAKTELSILLFAFSMSSLKKSTHIDRDDFDRDHYADVIRDAHRSRLTLDQLDVAKRQFKRREKLLTRIHELKMKEHSRIETDFRRKLEQDQIISNLPIVKEKLKLQRQQHLQAPTSPIDDISKVCHTNVSPRRARLRPDSPRTERLKQNIEKFNHETNTTFD